MKRAVKYCGGCNPRYDRVKFVKNIEANLGEILTSPVDDCIYDELYVICGCSAKCADISKIKAEKVFIFDKPEIPE